MDLDFLRGKKGDGSSHLQHCGPVSQLCSSDIKWLWCYLTPEGGYHERMQCHWTLFNHYKAYASLFMIELKLRYCMELSLRKSVLEEIITPQMCTENLMYSQAFIMLLMKLQKKEIMQSLLPALIKGPMLSWRRIWRTRLLGSRWVWLCASWSGSWKGPERKKWWTERHGTSPMDEFM